VFCRCIWCIGYIFRLKMLFVQNLPLSCHSWGGDLPHWRFQRLAGMQSKTYFIDWTDVVLHLKQIKKYFIDWTDVVLHLKQIKKYFIDWTDVVLHLKQINKYFIDWTDVVLHLKQIKKYFIDWTDVVLHLKQIKKYFIDWTDVLHLKQEWRHNILDRHCLPSKTRIKT
jgi:hypothetical protein